MKHITHNLARQAPAGRSIPRAAVWGRAGSSVRPPWPKLHVRYFDSGTAALAVAIRAALEYLRSIGGSRTVVLPAYGCPDLLAATLWAGGEPQFIDYQVDSVTPDPESLHRRLQQLDAVVVAVDSFGMDSLEGGFGKNLPPEQAALLVHDLAQSYAPYLPGWKPRVPSSIVSFGKAKPLSLTLGGALISDLDSSTHSSNLQIGRATTSPTTLSLRALAYNLSLNPLAFGVLARIPWLSIGQTHYTPLCEVREYDESFSRQVASAIEADHTMSERHAAKSREIVKIAVEAGVRLPTGLSTMALQTRLWRLPVICPSEAIAEGFAHEFASMGVSRLYGRPLPEFSGVSSAECERRWPWAAEIAKRLVTLPTHGRLNAEPLEQLKAGLRSIAG